jgi:tetratricopeptide (TPR) repeat protein
VWFAVAMMLVATPAVALAMHYADIEATAAEHTRAVELGRAGKYDTALRILGGLLAQFPDDYALNRDYIVIASWKGDCTDALVHFDRVRSVPHFEPYFVSAAAQCAVKRARAGDYDVALSVLKALRPSAPDPYPLERDIALITIWKGDCRQAIAEYDRIRGRPTYEAYFAAPMSDCLVAQRRPHEAITLVDAALRSAPADTDLRFARTKAEVSLRVDRGEDDTVPYAAFELSTDASDQGLREWFGRLEGGAGIASRTQLFARYSATRASDTQYANGNEDRAGLGVRYRFNEQWRLQQEFSTDIHHAGLGGSDTTLTYAPRDTVHFNGGYTTYAEDIPLRARAADIKAHRTDLAGAYDSTDYRWSGHVVGTNYNFTDGNVRRSIYATAGYAFEMRPQREQRLFLEWYASRNSLDGAVYFNPSQDRYVGIQHRTDFVYDTRFKRHVDHLTLWLGSYAQEGFATHGRWGVQYQQDYDFDQDNALLVGLSYARNVYDGAAEFDTGAELRYRRRF